MYTITLNQSEYQKQTVPLNITKLLGSGRACVYHGHSPAFNANYALKFFPIDHPSATCAFRHEKTALKELKHPNIVQYISEAKLNVDNKESNVLVMEYAPYGDFFDLMATEKFYDECLIRHYFHELIEGVEYLHSKKIAHFDIKPENLLIGKDYSLKITDFDQAQTPEILQNLFHGTAGYRAPEILEGKCTDVYAADVYSAGVTLFALVTKELLFAEKEVKGKKVLEGSRQFYENNEDFWRERASRCRNIILFDLSFQELMNGMLAKDPRKRFTIEQVKASRWYKGYTYNKTTFASKMRNILANRTL